MPVQPTSKKMLDAWLEERGLGHHRKAIAAVALPSIELVPASEREDEQELPLGRSKLGGAPDLPPEFSWPHNSAGQPLSFLAQIQCSDLPARVVEDLEGLAHAGRLWFFYNTLDRPAGLSPGDRGEFLVWSSRAEKKTLQPLVDAPQEQTDIYEACAVKPTATLSLPVFPEFIEEDEAEPYEELVLDLPEPLHKMVGHPNTLQSSMPLTCHRVFQGLDCVDDHLLPVPTVEELRAIEREWILLLQIDTDSVAGFEWGDSGRLFFWIRRQDLARGDFSQAWAILQSA